MLINIDRALLLFMQTWHCKAFPPHGRSESSGHGNDQQEETNPSSSHQTIWDRRGISHMYTTEISQYTWQTKACDFPEAESGSMGSGAAMGWPVALVSEAWQECDGTGTSQLAREHWAWAGGRRGRGGRRSRRRHGSVWRCHLHTFQKWQLAQSTSACLKASFSHVHSIHLWIW